MNCGMNLSGRPDFFQTPRNNVLFVDCDGRVYVHGVDGVLEAMMHRNSKPRVSDLFAGGVMTLDH